MNIRGVWKRIAKRRYTLLLEEEVARLRTENRALLNSILGIAGIPPVLMSESEFKKQVPLQGESAGSDATKETSKDSIRPSQRARSSQVQRRMLGVPAPVRHRSWQQINRMLELDTLRNREKPAGEILRAVGLERNGG